MEKTRGKQSLYANYIEKYYIQVLFIGTGAISGALAMFIYSAVASKMFVML